MKRFIFKQVEGHSREHTLAHGGRCYSVYLRETGEAIGTVTGHYSTYNPGLDWIYTLPGEVEAVASDWLFCRADTRLAAAEKLLALYRVA